MMRFEEVSSVNGLIHYTRVSTAENNKFDELTKLPRVVSCSNVKPNIIISMGGELMASVLEGLTCNPQEQTLLGIHVP